MKLKLIIFGMVRTSLLVLPWIGKQDMQAMEARMDNGKSYDTCFRHVYGRGKDD